MIDLLLKGTVLFAAGGVVTAAMFRSSAASRHAVWAAVFVAALVLPFAQAVLPSLGASWWPNLAVTPAASSVGEPDVMLNAVPPSTPVQGNLEPIPVPSSFTAARVLVGVWAMGFGLGLVRLFAGRRGARWLTSVARPADDPRVLARADLIGGWLGVPVFTVREGAPDWMPATWGVTQPVVVLPSTAGDWPDARLDPVLVHELAHVARRDAAWHQLMQVTLAMWWMHPLAWIAARQLRVERERACDDWVLAFGARASDYATNLVALVNECGGTEMTLAMARRSQLEGRVMAILNPRMNRNGRTGIATLAAAGLVLAVAPLASMTSARVTAEERPAPVAAAPQQAVRVGSTIIEPKKIKHVAPEYPEIAVAARVQGVVIIEINIDEWGAVSDAKVLRPVALLDEAALEAVRQWRYTPTTLNGVPVPIVMTVTVAFRLGEDGRPAPPPPPPPPPGSTSADQATLEALRAQVAALEARLTQAAAADRPAPTWSLGDPPLRVGGTIKEPRKIKHVAPAYPAVAQQARVQGIVIIEAQIDQDGRVSSARVIRSVALLDDAALDAVLQWEFEPTLLNGQPIPVLMTVTVSFTLTDD